MSSECNTNSLQAALTALDSEFAKVFSIFNERFAREWNRQYDQESLSSAARAAVGPESAHGENLHEKLDEICRSYLTVDGASRDRLREFVGSRRSLLYALRDHVSWCAKRIRSSHDREFLRTGIAAVSLQDNRLDFRDNYLALGDLYLAAIKVGIPPSLDFYKTGLLSSAVSRTKWPSDSTQNFLTGFEDSAYFKESIAPKLHQD